MFGKRMTPQERLRKHQRSLEKTIRELIREREKMRTQENKLKGEIKKSAKEGQMGAAKIQAKDLVRTRRYIEKFYSMETQLKAISLRIQVFLLYFRGYVWVETDSLLADCEDECADDGRDEGSNPGVGQYESQHESPTIAEDSDGV
jgi:hypothetical protein